MEYLKGTIKQLESYNDEVTLGENYQDSTNRWAEVIEANGEYFIPFNDKYPSELEKVNEIIYSGGNT